MPVAADSGKPGPGGGSRGTPVQGSQSTRCDGPVTHRPANRKIAAWPSPGPQTVIMMGPSVSQGRSRAPIKGPRKFSPTRQKLPARLKPVLPPCVGDCCDAFPDACGGALVCERFGGTEWFSQRLGRSRRHRKSYDTRCSSGYKGGSDIVKTRRIT
jgi:hypothetical protein